MTRHARNNTASAVYTYHERHRDTQNSGYGTIKARLSKDSVKDFDACSLTLQPCRNPVVTPYGFLYDKQAILEYIIHKKVEIAKSLKQYEKQKRREEKDLEDLAKEEMRSKTETFLKMEKGIVNSSEPTSSQDVGSSISNMSKGKASSLPSFWVPSMTPASAKAKLKKPDQTICCPMSGQPLKAKDLIEVKFTPINSMVDSSSKITQKERYICPICHDVLNNSIPCAVLRTSGNVVSMECVDKLIRKDMLDPTNGKKLKDKDIIVLERGGTGYSSTNELNAKIKKPVMMA